MFGLMLKSILFMGFATLILVLGNLIRWNGKTVSDQVRTQMAKVERSDTFRTARRELKESALGVTKKIKPKVDQKMGRLREKTEELTREEREHLRALLQAN